MRFTATVELQKKYNCKKLPITDKYIFFVFVNITSNKYYLINR